MLLQLDLEDLEQEMGITSRFTRKKVLALIEEFGTAEPIVQTQHGGGLYRLGRWGRRAFAAVRKLEMAFRCYTVFALSCYTIPSKPRIIEVTFGFHLVLFCSNIIFGPLLLRVAGLCFAYYCAIKHMMHISERHRKDKRDTIMAEVAKHSKFGGKFPWLKHLIFPWERAHTFPALVFGSRFASSVPV
jgi:hypothetical protein